MDGNGRACPWACENSEPLQAVATVMLVQRSKVGKTAKVRCDSLGAAAAVGNERDGAAASGGE